MPDAAAPGSAAIAPALPTAAYLRSFVDRTIVAPLDITAPRSAPAAKG